MAHRQPYAYLLNEGTIERPRLLSLSPVYSQKKVTLLEAPPGFGKSVLMAQWAEDAGFKGYELSWYRISEEDNSRPIFFSNLFNLLKSSLPTDTGMKNTGDSLEKFRELSARLPRKHIIFIHNLEHLRDRKVITALNNMVDHSGLSVFFVFAGNAGNMLPVSSYRAHNQLTHVGAASLAFTAEETASLFTGMLENQDLDVLLERTAGWPVALWYQKCRFEAGEDQILTPLETEGIQLSPDLEEFIEEQVMMALDPSLGDLLTSLSIFVKFTIKQARFVCDGKDVESVLMKQRLFPLFGMAEDVPDGFGFTPLFHQFLRKRLLARDAESLRCLHKRATDWFISQNMPLDALRHAAQAGDMAHMLDLFISFGGVEIGLREGVEALEDIVFLFSVEIAESEPQLLFSRVLIYMKDGKFAIARSLLERAVQRIASRGEDPSLEYYQSIVVMLMAVYEDKHVSREEINRYEEQSRQAMPGRFWSQGWFNNLLCMMYYAVGDMDKAREAATISLEFYSLADAAYSQVFMHVHLALINNITGDLLQSSRDLARAREICEKQFAADAGLSAIVTVLQADLDLVLGKEGEARQKIVSSLERVEEHEGWVELFIRGYVTGSLTEFIDGSPDQAHAVLDRGCALAVRRKLPRLERILEIQKLDLLTLSGDLEKARLLMTRLSLEHPPKVRALVEEASFQEAYRTVLAWSRYSIREGRQDEALKLLDEVSGIQDREKHFSFYLKSAVLKILALDGLGRKEEADDLFRKLASGADSRAYVHYFTGEGKSFRSFVGNHIKRVTLSQLPPEVVSFIGTLMADGNEASSMSDPANILTPKEYEVLQNLSAGHSNKVIALTMDLSETTVKFHMRNIFSKLGVQNRMMAVEVARAKNILTSP
ncbi:LuxR C-terminal-related transcriptional regulator [Emcibacter sp.]|uniref:LuxR C-terminal-related transcriptional regulator n=1 Tax=Emcibacter sp. TaxID=1979954 RepID=UPI003A8E6DCD